MGCQLCSQGSLSSGLTKTLDFCDFQRTWKAPQAAWPLPGEMLVSVLSSLSVCCTMFLYQLHVWGVMWGNWRSALPLRTRSRRKDLKIPHPNDQMSEVQEWPEAKPGLSRRCLAIGQLVGSL